MKNILVVGSNGMLGHDLVKVFEGNGYNVCGASRNDFDITEEEEVEYFFKDKTFDFVINSAAYTQVDKAEEECELAFLVNEQGAKNLAIASNKRNIPIVYISTDYVFDGKKLELYDINDKTNPINVYGKSKLAGEIVTKKENPQHYIVRTSWLYGKNGNNFVSTMLELSKTRDQIKVVNDQMGCPTWTIELSRAIEKLFKQKSEFGIYHLCAGGRASWYELALEIFRIKKVNIKVSPVETKEFPRAASRPSFSVMNNGEYMRPWEDAISDYLT